MRRLTSCDDGRHPRRRSIAIASPRSSALSVIRAAVASAATQRGRLVLRSLAKELLFEHDRRLASVYLAEAFPEAALIEAQVHALDALPRLGAALRGARRAGRDCACPRSGPGVRVRDLHGPDSAACSRPRRRGPSSTRSTSLPRPPARTSVERAYRGQPVASRVIQHRADSQALDFSGLVGRVDLVFSGREP